MSNLVTAKMTDDEVLQKIASSKVKFRFLLPSVLLRLKYQLWLVLLRETSIFIELMTHYDKIPKDSPTKKIIGLFVKYSWMKKMIFKVEKGLRKKIY